MLGLIILIFTTGSGVVTGVGEVGWFVGGVVFSSGVGEVVFVGELLGCAKTPTTSYLQSNFMLIGSPPTVVSASPLRHDELHFTVAPFSPETFRTQSFTPVQ
jgi:hypothetical protein